METITITLNGREVSGHAGMTVLEIAREAGVEIPTLCHDPHLAPYGACRVCLVEEERSGALLASCVTPIAPGMMVTTESPRVRERRKVIVKLMLASHPDSCLVCDKANRCDLRQIATDLGVGWGDYQRIMEPHTIEEVNPFIERDLSKCILCAKCIRADHELVVVGAIDYLGRGFDSKPATLYDMPLERSDCTFCGTCVAMCPTGALMEKERPYHGTTATTVETICPLCGCGCSMTLELKEDRIVRVRPGGDGSVNRGALCVCGSYGYDFVHSPQRLTAPLVKVDGAFQEATWEQALDIVAAEFMRLREAHGPNSLAVFGSSKCTNEENYLLQRFARGVLGTNNIDNGSRLYGAAARDGLAATLGAPGSVGSIAALERAMAILVVGADPTASAPIVGYAIKRAVKYRGAKLVLIDPQQTTLAAFASLWLRPRVGSDAALINGLMNVIIAEGLVDEATAASRATDFDALRRELEAYTPEYVERMTGVAAADIRHAARLFVAAGRAAIVFGNGVSQHPNGVAGATALADLALLTGNVGPDGGGIYALQRDGNGQGAADMGALPDFLPGHRRVTDAAARRDIGQRWGVALPAEAGLTALEMIEQARTGKLRGMYIVGENPAVSFPHLGLVKEVLDGLDFLVAQDMFLTETAKLADVVLPAASFVEKEGTLTNFEGRAQRLHKAIEPLGHSLPDWEIVLRLAARMGRPMPFATLPQVAAEIEALVPWYKGMGEAVPGAMGPHQAGVVGARLGARPSFEGRLPGGAGRFVPVRYTPPPEAPHDGYALTLLTGAVLYRFGAGSRSALSSRLRRYQPDACVEIGAADAARLGIADGDAVNVVSPVAEVGAIARITDRAPEGTVFMPVSFPESPANALFAITDATAPSLKACAVRLERIETP